MDPSPAPPPSVEPVVVMRPARPFVPYAPAIGPKLRALLHEFQQLEVLVGAGVEPWYARPLAQEAADAR